MQFNSLKKRLGFLLLILVAATFCFPSCTAAYKRRKKEEHLKSAVNSFNTNMRWQQYSKASRFVKDEERDVFIDYYERRRETLQIMEMDLVSAKVNKKDPNKGTARVWTSYFNMPDPHLRKELKIQEWEFEPSDQLWVVSLPELQKLLPPKKRSSKKEEHEKVPEAAPEAPSMKPALDDQEPIN